MFYGQSNLTLLTLRRIFSIVADLVLINSHCQDRPARNLIWSCLKKLTASIVKFGAEYTRFTLKILIGSRQFWLTLNFLKHVDLWLLKKGLIWYDFQVSSLFSFNCFRDFTSILTLNWAKIFFNVQCGLGDLSLFRKRRQHWSMR